MNKQIRIAIEKATGRKYIIQQCELPKNGETLVHVWGECMKTRGLQTQHEGSKTFRESEVEITEVEKTQDLLEELFQQAIKVKKEMGGQWEIARSRMR